MKANEAPQQYIPKSALVAELNRLIAELVEEGENTMFEQGRISAFEDAKLFLDTLEVKEMQEEPISEDLEKAAKIYTLDDSIKPWRNLTKEAFLAGAKWQKQKDQKK